MSVTEEEMIREWGSPEAYFKELERFLELHRNADLRTHESDTGALVGVEYLFRPYQVVVEMRELRARIAATCSEPAAEEPGKE